MTSVMKGGFAPPTTATSTNDPSNTGTQFIALLAPPGAALMGYNNTLPASSQTLPLPTAFLDAMQVRETVYAAQGVPLDAEFDDDDARSWHWIVYASEASTSAVPADLTLAQAGLEARNPEEERRRASASAVRVPVGTIRLIPPPHGPNKYLVRNDSHSAATTDAETRTMDDQKRAHNPHPNGPPPPPAAAHPKEPYIKLGRLAVLPSYRGLGLAQLLVSAALDFASHSAHLIAAPPSPTQLAVAQIHRHEEAGMGWEGLCCVHAQVGVGRMWERFGFKSVLEGVTGAKGEERWIEEGIEHVGMWRRVRVEERRVGSV